MHELITAVEASTPDVIGISETWGNDDILESEFSIPGCSVFRADRNNGHRGGGVLLLVNNTFCPVEVKLNSKFCDQIWCKVKIKGSEELYRSLLPFSQC